MTCDRSLVFSGYSIRFPPPIKLTDTITEVLSKVALNTITLTLTPVEIGNFLHQVHPLSCHFVNRGDDTFIFKSPYMLLALVVILLRLGNNKLRKNRRQKRDNQKSSIEVGQTIQW